MTKKSTQTKQKFSIPIIIAIISLLGVCITTIGSIIVGVFPNVLDIFKSSPNKIETITFRVTDVNGTSISKAKVILLSGNDIHIQYTDSNGTSVFSLIKTETLRVFVETDEFEIYDQIFSSNTKNPIEIRLSLKDISRKSVIIRVIDNKDDLPINGAEVILIANGNIYSQITDSNGITKFTTAFPSDEIDGDISVSVSGFKAEHQMVTLQADRVQDIRLDKTSGTITVGFTGQTKEAVKSPEPNNNETTKSNTNNNEVTPYNCSSRSLSPEEKANCGQHTYAVEGNMITEECYFKLEDGSEVRSYSEEQTIINIFESDSVTTVFDNATAISSKVRLNTYEYTDEDSVSITEFTLDGWVDENTWDICTSTTKATLIK